MKEEILIHLGKIIMGCYTKILLKMDIQNNQNFPDGPKIFACNHPTTTDPFFLNLISKEPIRILVTGNAFEVPLFGSYLRHAGHIPVKPGEGQGQEIVNRAVEYLNNGKSVGIFPEGSLSPELYDGYGVLHARSGAARIALASGRPIIPVGIALRNHRIHKKHYHFSDRETTGRWIVAGEYIVTVGSPLHAKGKAGEYSAVQQTSAQLTTEISKLVSASQERSRLKPLKMPPILAPYRYDYETHQKRIIH